MNIHKWDHILVVPNPKVKQKKDDSESDWSFALKNSTSWDIRHMIPFVLTIIPITPP
jgi:hypothetical protein